MEHNWINVEDSHHDFFPKKDSNIIEYEYEIDGRQLYETYSDPNLKSN